MRFNLIACNVLRINQLFTHYYFNENCLTLYKMFTNCDLFLFCRLPYIVGLILFYSYLLNETIYLHTSRFDYVTSCDHRKIEEIRLRTLRLYFFDIEKH